MGVVAERRPGRSVWQDHHWRVVGVLADPPELEAWSVLCQADGTARFYAGCAILELHAAEADFYRHNAEGPSPSVYVVLRRAGSPTGMRLLLVTVNPSEAEAHVDAGDDLLEAVPMPEAVREWVWAFTRRHRQRRPVWHRRRDGG